LEKHVQLYSADVLELLGILCYMQILHVLQTDHQNITVIIVCRLRLHATCMSL